MNEGLQPVDSALNVHKAHKAQQCTKICIQSYTEQNITKVQQCTKTYSSLKLQVMKMHLHAELLGSVTWKPKKMPNSINFL